MSFLTTLLFKLAYYGITIGYPAYQVYQVNKNKQVERMWILYFFIFGLFAILESTLLWPLKFVLSLVCDCTWMWIKLLLAIWLQHPSYRGALFIEQKGGKFIDLAYNNVYPAIGKVLAIIGVPERNVQASK